MIFYKKKSGCIIVTKLCTLSLYFSEKIIVEDVKYIKSTIFAIIIWHTILLCDNIFNLRQMINYYLMFS